MTANTYRAIAFDSKSFIKKAITALTLTLITTLVISSFAPVWAKATKEQEDAALVFVTDISDRAFEALRDPELEGDAQRQRFRELLLEGVAIDYVAPLLLGRFYRTADEEQITEYRRIFPEYIISFYTDQLLKIGDEELRVIGTQPVGRSDVYVRTELLRPNGGDPIAADWRVKHTKEGLPKIIDLKVEGISIAETKRDEFASLISSRGFDGFLKEIRTQAYGDKMEPAE
ncbi:MAG: ABC transporter substrate-binding protein [Sphingomonadales bacterium]|jgi:phospholipid transport system substrate-binding protein